MKRTLTVISLILVMAISGINLEAKKTSRTTGSRKSTKTSSVLAMSKTANGYYNPAGHAFRNSSSNGSVTFTFEKGGKGTMEVYTTAGSMSFPTNWSVDSNGIFISYNGEGNYIYPSSDGKALVNRDGERWIIIR